MQNMRDQHQRMQVLAQENAEKTRIWEKDLQICLPPSLSLSPSVHLSIEQHVFPPSRPITATTARKTTYPHLVVAMVDTT